MNDDLKGSRRGLTEPLSRHLPGRIEENHENLSQDNPTSRPRFKPSTPPPPDTRLKCYLYAILLSFKLWTSGPWHRVIWWMVTDVSEGTYCPHLRMEDGGSRFIRNVGNHQTTCQLYNEARKIRVFHLLGTLRDIAVTYLTSWLSFVV
jgi:hypothetical protein